MAEHRRRPRRDAAIAPQEELTQSAAETPEEQELPAERQQSAAPRRRRRAQPPREITQKIPKIVVPEETQISETPLIEEQKKEKKRYRKAPNASKRAKPRNNASAERREKAAQVLKGGGEKGALAFKAAGGMLQKAGIFAGALLKKAATALTGGAKKAFGLLMILLAGIKEKIEAHQGRQSAAQEEQQEIVLEAIRPQDYHGRGAQHAAQPEKKKKAVSALFSRLSGAQTQRLISAALVLVAAVSLWQIGSILLRTFRTTRLNAQLSERYASMGGNEQAEESEEVAFTVYDGEQTPMPAATPTPEPAQKLAEKEPEATPVPAATRAPELVKTTKFHHMGGDALPEMEALYNENRDLVAWLNIPEVIDLPVVYRDNDYYLKRDFYKQKNTAGTIFLDENHPFKEKTQNLLLHGHNMKDGTMFGRLTQYIYDKTYIKNHPFVNLSTLWRKEQYVIFAILDVSLNPKEETFFNYFTHATFSSDAEFTSYIRQLQLRSMVAIPIDVDPSDALLTLSTCLEENRLVIVARRLRNGETRAQLRQRIHTATRQ